MKKPVIFAHRGASKAAPENTMAAFKKAIEMNAGGIELDTHLTGDGHLVVIHDDHLGRTCNGYGYIKDLNLKYLRGLDFGGWFSKEFAGERIPLLSEVLELIKGKPVILNIEIKASPGRYADGIERKVAEMIKAYDMIENTVVSSFNHYSLLKMKAFNREIMTAPLYCGVFADVGEYAAKIGACAVHPNGSDVTPEVVKSCRQHHTRIHVWTVDNENDMVRLTSLGDRKSVV